MTTSEKLLQRAARLLVHPGAIVRDARGAWVHGNGCTGAPCTGCGAIRVDLAKDGEVTAVRNSGKLSVELGGERR